MPHLKSLRVRYLDLSGSGVTDESLTTLAEVPSLTFLDLTDTKATEQGVEALQADLPRVLVYPFNRKVWTLPASSFNGERPPSPTSPDAPEG